MLTEGDGASRLSRALIVRTAVRLADADGLETLTMRRLATELGAGAMSLYHHVPNKTALLDGMVDAVFAEIELPVAGGKWKAAMRRRAVSTLAALRRHPWAVGRMESTREPGPADLRLHDAVLGCLRAAGFSVPMSVQANSVLDAYIYGFALQQQALPQEDFAEAAQQRVQEVETRMRDAARIYPHLAEVVGGYVARHGYDFDNAFKFGLDVILDGLDALRSRRGR